jgi:hypothetical protein
MGDVDIAMNFFCGLENARYAAFKPEILNRFTAKSITQPANLHVVYLLANQWVKPVTRGNAVGFASTFHTMLNRTERSRGNQPEGGGNRRREKEKVVSSSRIQRRKKAVIGRRLRVLGLELGVYTNKYLLLTVSSK